MSRSLSRAEFDDLFARVSTWGRWGPRGRMDGMGALNELTAERVRSAASLVQHGRFVSMGLPWSTRPEPDNQKPALHFLLLDVDDGEPTVNMDFIGADYHGKSVSHVDAFRHCAYRGQLYGGVAVQEIANREDDVGSVLPMAEGLVGRGVLLDVPRARGEPFLEPGSPIGADHLQAAADREHVRVGAGDVVIVRTGHRAVRLARGPWDPSDKSAGLHVDAIPWLHERSIAVLGADGDSDLRPSPVEGVRSPVHVLTLTAMGVPLLDNLDLEPLAGVCAELGRWEFLFCCAPLKVPGATGSPVNPIAIF